MKRGIPGMLQVQANQTTAWGWMRGTEEPDLYKRVRISQAGAV